MQKDKKTNKKLQKKDLIRIKNGQKKLEEIKNTIYEFILLENAKIFFKKNYVQKAIIL